MRILLVGGGASFSIKDVETGYLHALQNQGHDVIEYKLDQRIEVAARHLTSLFNYTDRHKPRAERRRPTRPEILWTACAEIVTRALWHKVDFVLIVSAIFLHPDFLVLLRRAKVPSVVILTESPYMDEQHERLLPYIDVAFTNERSSVERLRRINADVYYLPCAFDPAVHYPEAALDADVPSYDVIFVGTGFPERIKLLAGVDWSGVNLGLFGTYNLLPRRHPLREYIRGGVTPNATAAALYRKAAIGLNLYRTADGAESLNPRGVELAACGAFHLSEYRAEVGEVFGGLVKTFQSSEELGALVRDFLDSPYRRGVLREQLPAAVAHLTFDAQVATMVTTLRVVWGGGGSQAQAAD